MTEEMKIRKEKLDLIIEKGYNVDIINGIVYGLKGQKIGYVDKLGYGNIRVNINSKKYHIKIHQFIYYVATGKIVEQIDHINHNTNDNRINNLRSATNSTNQWNKSNTKGYHWNKRANKWQAEIVVDKEKIYLGLFDNEDDAKNAYLKPKQKYHILNETK